MRLRLLWGPLLGLTALAWTTWAGGISWLPVLAYWAAWCWSVVTPGMLVHRSLRGRPEDLVSDVALGTAVGLVLQLMAWAVLTSLGLAHYLLGWPVLLLVLFGATPRLRRHLSLAPYASVTPTGAAALAALAFVVVLRQLTDTFRDFALPPQAMSWYQDDLWNLGNVAELMRTATPQVAQVAGEPFRYHWFSDAHLAAMSLTTSIDPVLVVGRLWAAPVLLLIVALSLAVGRRVSGSAWVGAGVALCFTAGLSLQVSWFEIEGAAANEVRSPSQVFAVPLVLLAIDLLVSLLRAGRSSGPHSYRTWLLLVPVLVACAGAKSSVLPVLGGGLVLTSAVAVFVARHRLRVLVPAAALVAAVVLTTRSRLAGGENGSILQLFATYASTAPWQLVHDGNVDRFDTGPIIPGLQASGAGVVLALILGCALVSYLWVLVGLPVLSRGDLSGWFLLGTGLAGLAALLTIRHPAYSQVYFLKVAIPAWQLLALWGLHRSLRTATRRSGVDATVHAAVVGVVAGVTVLALARLVGRPPAAGAPASAVAPSIQWSLVVFAVAALAATSLLLVSRRGNPIRSALVTVALSAATLSAAATAVLLDVVGDAVVSSGLAQAVTVLGVGLVVAAMVVVWRRASRAAHPDRRGGPHPLRTRSTLARTLTVVTAAVVAAASVMTYLAQGRQSPPDPDRIVTADEVVAARWLGAAAQPFDVVATNVHCRPTRTAPNCDARAFWVSGLSGQRVLVEGWGYTDAAQAAFGRGGLGFNEQPFQDPALLALNDRVFTDPSRANVAALAAKGVRWLFADALAGPVSPDLANLATPVFRAGSVQVYRVDPPPKGSAR